MRISKGELHQSLALITVVCNEFVMGLGVGWTSPTLSGTQNANHIVSLTSDQLSWIASSEYFGKIFSIILCTFMLDIVGRTPVLVLTSFIFPCTWLGIRFTESVRLIYVIRFIFGFAIGLNNSVNSIYLGEVSSPQIRNIFGCLCMTMSFAGVFVEFVVATYLSYMTTATVNALISLSTLFALSWLTETTPFLLLRGKTKLAEKNFMWLNGVNDLRTVGPKLETISSHIQAEVHQQQSIAKNLVMPASYKSILLVSVIFAFLGLTGYSPIISFASHIFPGTDSITPNEFAIMLGVSQVAAALTASFTYTHLNRRTVILVGFTVNTILQLCTATLSYAQAHWPPVPHYSCLLFFTVTLYVCTYVFVFPTLFLIRAELFPLRVKAIGGCIALAGFGITSGLITKMFLYICVNYGIYVNFLIFSAANLVIVAVVYRYLPETRNMSLCEIQKLVQNIK